MPVVTGRTKSATSISTSGISCTSPRVMRLKEISMLPARATMASPTVTLVRNGPLNTACRTLIEESSGCEDDQAALQGAENRSCLAQVMRSGTVGLVCVFDLMRQMPARRWLWVGAALLCRLSWGYAELRVHGVLRSSLTLGMGSSYSPISLADRPTSSGYRGRSVCLAKVVANPYEGETRQG